MLPPVLTYPHAGLLVEIRYDEHASSPREMDPLGTIIGWRRADLKLGERQIDLDSTTPQQVVDKLKRDGARLILPVHYTSHGPHCQLHLGDKLDDDTLAHSSGIVYVTDEELRSAFLARRITAHVLRKARRLLNAEINEYSHWLNGSVYGYVIRDADKSSLASDFGYYGIEDCESEANPVAEDCARQQQAEEVEAHHMACRDIQTLRSTEGAARA